MPFFFLKKNVILNNPEISGPHPPSFVCCLCLQLGLVTLRVGFELGREFHKIPTDTPALFWSRLQPRPPGKPSPSEGGEGDGEKPDPLLFILSLDPSFCFPFCTRHAPSPPPRQPAWIRSPVDPPEPTDC